MNDKKPLTINAYIALFPKDIQVLLERMRKTIHEVAPDAEEAIRYQMPAFQMNGKNLVFFAAFAHHIGFYPIPSGMTAFKKELSGYKQGKGSVQFPLDEPIPFDLVRKIVLYRVKEMEAGMKRERKK